MNPKKIRNKCLNCNIEVKRINAIYCCNRCQHDYQYKQYIIKWKSNEISGVTYNGSISGYIRRYLFEKYDYKCSKCNWLERNIITNTIPIEIDHIDGNSENNNESNLRLLCPNCHSLTPTFRSLNNGNGRKNRRLRH